MKLLTFLRLMREIRKKGKTDIEKIQRMGLLAVKLSQIFALRPDLLSPEKCKELQGLYQKASSIPPEDSMKILKDKAPDGFFENVLEMEPNPFAAASIGQVHRAKLKDGTRLL